jgi:ferredoxin
MITAIDESYFFVRGKIVGKDERPEVEKYEVHRPESKEDIDRCLNCKYVDCTDVCPYSPYYRNPVKKNSERKTRFKKIYESKLSEEERKTASEVARLHKDGWTEGGTAWKLGITRSEVELFMNIAKKAGYLD